jgi:methylmalonyl-CoA/ethylmalonyl-CoA epimerase
MRCHETKRSCRREKVVEREAPLLPKLGQVAVIVKDLQKAIEHYSALFGIGPFDVYDVDPRRNWVDGKEVKPQRVKVAMADMGQVKLELLQLVDCDEHNLLRRFFDTHGEGLQHLGFYCSNYDEWRAYAREKGMDILFELEVEDEVRGRRRGFFMDSAWIGGVLFEMIEVHENHI